MNPIRLRSLPVPARVLLSTAVLAAGALAAPGSSLAASRAHRHPTVTHHRARTFSFYATVVRSSPTGLLVRLRSGKQAFFSTHQLTRRTARPAHKRSVKRAHHRLHHGRLAHVLAHAADSTPPVSVNIVGLQPGVTILVTETVNPDGSVTITITLPPSSAASSPQTVSGTVGDVNTDTFDVQTPDGSDFVFHMAADTLAALGLQSCDTVDVTFHQDSELLIADTVNTTGTDTSGDCAPTSDVTGPITAVSDTGVTLSTDSGSMSFTVDDPSVTDGFQVGDVVDVTYTDNGDGTFTAVDVEYVENDASGTVTSVSATTLTITDSSTGATDTFAATPDSGVSIDGTGFDGVQVGDQVDVTYHVSNGQSIADDVSDSGPSGGEQSGGSSGGDQSGASSTGDSSTGGSSSGGS